MRSRLAVIAFTGADMRFVLALGMALAVSPIGPGAPPRAAMSGANPAGMPAHAAAGYGARPAQREASLGVDAVHPQTASPQTERAPPSGCKSPVLRARFCRSVV